MKTLDEYLVEIPSFGPNTGMKLVEIASAIRTVLVEGVKDKDALDELENYMLALDLVTAYAAKHQKAVLDKLTSLTGE